MIKRKSGKLIRQPSGGERGDGMDACKEGPRRINIRIGIRGGRKIVMYGLFFFLCIFLKIRDPSLHLLSSDI